MTITRRDAMTGFISAAGLSFALAAPASAASAADLIRDSDKALANLYAKQPKAKLLGDRATAILVFPNIIKAGFMVAAQSGNGVLFEGGVPTNYYNISAGSFGFQAGVKSFSYALFFMNSSALSYLSSSHGWSIGAGPSVVVLDKGAAASMTSTTLTQDVYAIPFGQEGLMGGIGLEGAKITSISVGP